MFCGMYKVTNACIDELLQFISNVILPSPNLLLNSEEIATTMLNCFRLKYVVIDVCKNICVLFRHEFAEMEICRTMGI